MKYEVLRDFGVDVAGQHYAHGATIDTEAAPKVPEEVPEEHRAEQAEGLKRATEADIAALVKDGLVVEAAATTEAAAPAVDSTSAKTRRSEAASQKEGR